MKYWLVLFLFVGQGGFGVFGQKYNLTYFDLNRTQDTVYMANMVRLAHQNLGEVKAAPPGLRKDSTVLRIYNYLGSLYRESKNHKDSTMIYGGMMQEYAQKCGNIEFEVKGLFQQSHYYRNFRLDLQEALRINLKAQNIIESAGQDPQVLWRVYLHLGDIYVQVREYDKALDYYRNAAELIKKGTGISTIATEAHKLSIVQGIANIYTFQKQYDLAEKYFNLAIEMLQNSPILSNGGYIYNDFSLFYSRQKKYEEAVKYAEKAEVIWKKMEKVENLAITQASLALAHAPLGHLDVAEKYAETVVQNPRAGADATKYALMALYEVAQRRENWKSALNYFEKYITVRDSAAKRLEKDQFLKIQNRFELEKMAMQNQQNRELQARELANVVQQNEFDKLKTAADYENYLAQAERGKLRQQLETQILREAYSDQEKIIFQNETRQEKIINKLKIKELEQIRDNQRMTRNFLISTVVLFIILGAGLMWYNRKLMLKNLDLAAKNEVIKQATRRIQLTEIAALRAQMNPHFIFNCLNSIQYFTAQNNSDKASEYLGKFSKLIRLVLENSRSEKVTLRNEIETLKLYMDMEAMRFGNKVSYQVNVDADLETDSVQIPPLLLQPFVENAIWHGLMHKELGGTVVINVETRLIASLPSGNASLPSGNASLRSGNATLPPPTHQILRVSITDDGVGRAKAAEYKSKSANVNKSFGMKVTAERIELINQLYNTNAKAQIFDLKDSHGNSTGTNVTIEIPI